MKVELKAIKYSAAMSRETNAYDAKLYVDGKMTANVFNDGGGGNTSIVQVNAAALERLTKAEEWAKSLPPVPSEFSDSGLPMDLEFWCDLQIDEYLKKQEQKKLEKRQLQAILWGKPNAGSYYEVKLSRPIDHLLGNHNGRAFLVQTLDKYRKTFKEGEQFLNTNIPAEFLTSK